jgi:DNA-binding NtrC family response regulator
LPLARFSLGQYEAGRRMRRAALYAGPVIAMRRTSPKVLLISNEKALWRQLRLCLSRLGVAATALMMVKSGHEGVVTAARLRPYLVVFDDKVNDVSAQDLLRALHQHAPEVLVIYLASHHTAELECTVRQFGVLYYTEQPLDTILFAKVLGAVFAAAEGMARDRGLS